MSWGVFLMLVGRSLKTLITKQRDLFEKLLILQLEYESQN